MFDPDDTAAQVAECEGLIERAQRLFPASPYLQHEWLRAVLNVRMTHRGWVLDGQVERCDSFALVGA